MPLAGHSHVFHAVKSIFYRAFGELRRHRDDPGPCVCLIFLPAEPAAEPLYVDLDLMHLQSGHTANRTLHRCRALGRGIYLEAAILSRHGVCTLRLDVEMLLPVLLSPAFENMSTIAECVRRIAKYKFLRRNNQSAVRGRDTRVGHRFKFIDLDRDLLRGLSREFFRFRKHDRDRHPLKMHLALSKQRLVRHDPADLVLADQVFGRYHFENTFALFRYAFINAS